MEDEPIWRGERARLMNIKNKQKTNIMSCCLNLNTLTPIAMIDVVEMMINAIISHWLQCLIGINVL